MSCWKYTTVFGGFADAPVFIKYYIRYWNTVKIIKIRVYGVNSIKILTLKYFGVIMYIISDRGDCDDSTGWLSWFSNKIKR